MNTDWQYCVDKATGCAYWYNSGTGESKWIESMKTQEWTLCRDEMGNSYYFNEVTGESKWGEQPTQSGSVKSKPEDAAAWEEVTDPATGQVYYWNSKTGATQWNNPRATEEMAELGNDSVDREDDDLLQDEEERRQKRFDRLKQGARTLDRCLSNDNDGIWLKYQTVNDGPVFYAKAGQSGGQWEAPEEFKLLAQSKAAKSTKESITTPVPPDVTSPPPTMNILSDEKVADTEPAQADHSLRVVVSPAPAALRISEITDSSANPFDRSPETDYKRIAKAAIVHTDSTKSSPVASKLTGIEERLRSAYKEIRLHDRVLDFGNEESGSEDLFNTPFRYEPRSEPMPRSVEKKLLDTLRSDDDVNPDPAEQRSITIARLTESFRAESSIEEAPFTKASDLKELETAADSRIQLHGTSLFDAMKAHSIVMQRKGVWSKLVDLRSDKDFYFNEESNHYQFDVPECFSLTADLLNSKKLKSAQDMNHILGSGLSTEFNVLTRELTESSTPMLSTFKEELRRKRENMIKTRQEEEESKLLQQSCFDDRGVGVVPVVNRAVEADAVVEAAFLAEVRPDSFQSNAHNAFIWTPSQRAQPESQKTHKPVNKNVVVANKLLEETLLAANVSEKEIKKETPEDRRSRLSVFSREKRGDFSRKYHFSVHASSQKVCADASQSKNELLRQLDRGSNKVLSTRLTVLGKLVPEDDSSGHSAKVTKESKPLSERSHSQSSSGKTRVATLKNPYVYVSVEEKARKALQESVELEREMQEALQVKSFLKQISELIEEPCEIDSRSLGCSWLEGEMARRHLLEATVLQRARTVMPFGLREAKAYQLAPLSLCCPHALPTESLFNVLQQESIGSVTRPSESFATSTGLRNTSSHSLVEWTRRQFRGWDILVHKDSSCKRRLFVDTVRQTSQAGIPFDIMNYEKRGKLLEEMRQDYDAFMVDDLDQLGEGASDLTLLSDELGGLLFYDRKRDRYAGRPHRVLKQRISKSKQSFSHTPTDFNEKRQSREDLLFPETSVWPAVFLTPEIIAASKRVACRKAPLETTQKERFVPESIPETQLESTSAPPLEKKTIKSKKSSISKQGLEELFAPKAIPRQDSAALASSDENQNAAIVEGEADSARKTTRFKLNSAPTTATATFSSLEGFLNEISQKNSEACLLEEYKNNCKPLSFESAFTESSYDQYKARIAQVALRPNSAVPLLDLSIWLLLRGLGRQAWTCFNRAKELLSAHRLTGLDMAKAQLLHYKFSTRFSGACPSELDILTVASNFPESSTVLASAAFCLRQIHCNADAEKLYTAALMLNPLHASALRGYAHLLVENGNLFAAHRYLSRVLETAVSYPMCKIEMAWIEELQNVDDEALIVAYKATLSLLLKDRATSFALHSIGHFHHVRGNHVKALEFYGRSLRIHPTNAIATLLTASLLEGPTQGAQIDALYRRGLVLLPHGEVKWIALLANATQVLGQLRDLDRAEELLIEATRLTLNTVVWPAIALAHFYQYVRCDPKKSLRLLMWCLRLRRDSLRNSSSLDLYFSDTNDCQDDLALYLSEIKENSKSNQESTVSEKSQNTALLSAIAFAQFDLDRLEDAAFSCKQALTLDDSYSPALRCLGLVDWRNSHRISGSRLLKSASNMTIGNPNSLRCLSVVEGILNRYESAYTVMRVAVSTGQSCPLAWRALGVMAYLYKKNVEEALNLLSRAFVLSEEIDLEALRLKGQILLETGKLNEARECFQAVLRVQPRDPVTICSLALTYSIDLTAKQKKKMKKLKKSLKSRKAAKSTPEFEPLVELTSSTPSVAGKASLIDCNNPEILFRTALSLTTSVSPIGGSEEAFQLTEEPPATALTFLTRDFNEGTFESNVVSQPLSVPTNTQVYSEVRYLSGVHLIKLGTTESLESAKKLFSEAVQRQDVAPCVLSLYMLGWLAENSGDLILAEKYYSFAIQLEPQEPLTFLKLFKLANDTFQHVKELNAFESISSKKKKKLAETQMATDSQFTAIFSQIAPMSCAFPLSQSASCPVLREDTEFPSDAVERETVLLREADNNLVLSSQQGAGWLHRRLLLHERVMCLARLRRTKMESSLIGLRTPPAFVFLDLHWQQRLLHAFSQCDDWSWLLKNSAEFVRKVELTSR